jgi:hypothetical protein
MRVRVRIVKGRGRGMMERWRRSNMTKQLLSWVRKGRFVEGVKGGGGKRRAE